MSQRRAESPLAARAVGSPVVSAKALLYAAVFVAFDLAAFLIIYSGFALGVQRFAPGAALTAGAFSVLGRLFSLQPLLLFVFAAASAYFNVHRYFPVLALSTLLAMVLSAVIQSQGRVTPTISSLFAISIDQEFLGAGIPLLLSCSAAWLMIHLFVRRLH